MASQRRLTDVLVLDYKGYAELGCHVDPMTSNFVSNVFAFFCVLYYTSGFWPRVRARLFGLIAKPNGALRAPRPSQLRCFLFDPQK
jgi:hypothetical protein